MGGQCQFADIRFNDAEIMKAGSKLAAERARVGSRGDRLLRADGEQVDGVDGIDHVATTVRESNNPIAINQSIPSIVAHEFYHIVTPLNIHSEIIEYFNFVEPVASEHVWLYEGTTEWVAHMAQLRSGLIDLEEYLSRLSGKMQADDRFDKDFSLSRLSLESYSAKGQQEWGNI